MRNRVERLRVWLLGSAVFLILVIAGFIGSARYLRHRFLAGLPKKLGFDITSDASGVTLSHAVGGRTDYVVHAAKKEEHTSGTVTLHGVSILLYGAKGNRQDRIQGDEFEYDPKSGVLRAVGLVHIDLQSAGGAVGKRQVGEAGPAGPDSGAAGGSGAGGKVLHVTTSGLVYLEKLGVAATSEYIEFQSGEMKGHATGADYASDSGMLMLHSAVSMSETEGGRPLTVTAATANYDDQNKVSYLTQAKYESQGRTATAEQATLHGRPDGTLARVEAQGNVTAVANGATVVSQRADVMLTAAGQPQSAVLTGGVKYSSDLPLRQVRGQADAATIGFDAQKPQPNHAVFSGAVHMTERTRATVALKEPWSTRDLTAAKVEAELAPAGPGRSQLRDAEATGSPHLTVVNNGSLASSAGEGTTELSGDDLKAHMLATGEAKQPAQLDTIVGRGHTLLRQMSVDGIEQTSAGDTLNAKFRPRVASGAGPGAGKPHLNPHPPGPLAAPDLLLSAVQEGHVTMMRRSPARGGGKVGGVKAGAKPGGTSGSNSASEAASDSDSDSDAQDDVEHATAQRAAYDGDLDRMTLTGGVQVTDVGSVLWANQVALDHRTGDSHAMGAVKVDYVQVAAAGKASQPGATAEQTHVLAERADMEHATDVATFHGKPVRLWQEGSQVQAPVIELFHAQKRMIARGEAGTGWSAAAQAAQVRTILMSARSDSGGAAGAGAGKAGPAVAAKPGCENAAPGKAGAGAAGAGAGGTGVSGTGARSPDAVSIASGGLVYSDVLRQADFTGGVRADTVDGTIRAVAATVYLQPGPGQAAGAAGVPSMAGELDRVVATGHVELNKPGLRATGERLVYTARDRVILLTGDGSTPPKAVDAQGTTTGAALRFQSSCGGSGSGSVEVLGAIPGEPAQRVRTDSQIGDGVKKEKGKR